MSYFVSTTDTSHFFEVDERNVRLVSDTHTLAGTLIPGTQPTVGQPLVIRTRCGTLPVGTVRTVIGRRLHPVLR